MSLVSRHYLWMSLDSEGLVLGLSEAFRAREGCMVVSNHLNIVLGQLWVFSEVKERRPLTDLSYVLPVFRVLYDLAELLPLEQLGCLIV